MSSSKNLLNQNQNWIGDPERFAPLLREINRIEKDSKTSGKDISWPGKKTLSYCGFNSSNRHLCIENALNLGIVEYKDSLQKVLVVSSKAETFIAASKNVSHELMLKRAFHLECVPEIFR